MATKLIQNILKMTQVLLQKKPSFIDSDSITLSWKKPIPKKRQASTNENLKNPDSKKKKFTKKKGQQGQQQQQGKKKKK